MLKPVVASYCTTFLKPEMLHIYRQVTGLRRYATYILTRQRQCEDQFPFSDVELFQKKKMRKNFVRRFWLKHVRKLPAVYYRGEFQSIMLALDRRRTDLMHIYFGHTGVHLLPFIRHWDKPSVVSFHGMDIQPRPHQPHYDAQMQELLRAIPLVLARSQSLAARLMAMGCPPEKLRINRTGIPLEKFPFVRRTMPENGQWRFVQACRLIKKKGLHTALRAFGAFRERYPESRYIIAGEGPMRQELEKMIQEMRLDTAVSLRGFLGQGELRELYQQSHVFLHPSELTEDQNQEGIPNSMLEAMATGLPVLATLHGGIPEAVKNGETGFLVAERDHEALFQAMLEITGSADRASAMGAAASTSVHQDFEHSAQIARLESYYDEARQIGKLAT